MFRNSFSNKKLKESKLGVLSKDSRESGNFLRANASKTTKESKSLVGKQLNSPSVNSFALNLNQASTSQIDNNNSSLMRIMNENHHNRTVFLNTDQSIQEEDYMGQSRSLYINDGIANIDERLNSIMGNEKKNH